MTEGGITLLQRSSDDEDRTAARVSELGGGAAAGPGIRVDLIRVILAWADGGKSGLEELAAQPGEHVDTQTLTRCQAKRLRSTPQTRKIPGHSLTRTGTA